MDDPEYEMFQSARTRQQSPGSPSSPIISSRRRNSHSESRTRHHDQVENPDTRSQESVGRAAFTEDASHLQPAANRTRDRPMSSNSSFDERNTIVPKPLTAVDLASLVFNKMVGTGIFTVPGHVLAATSSKKVSIGLWVAGGFYTALCLTAYLELGAQFPYDGGELIYLDRTLRPGLMWTMAFATFFITIANTSGNAIAFARFVMIAALPTNRSLVDLDSKVVKLIAISILSVVCLLHYLSSNLGRFLNKLLALYKLCLLVAVMSTGFWAYRINKAGLDDDTLINAVPQGTESKLGAVVLVLYSFTGWENANYVAGEIRSSDNGESSNQLPIGAYSAIAVVTVLYLLVALSYYLAFTYKDITEYLDLGMARNLGPMAFKPDGISLDILFALSAFGNLIAVVYTSARVKQAIARQRLLPFWKYLEKDAESPKGGLFLHWLFTTIMILAAPVGPDGYGFIVGLYTYGQIVVVTFAVIGLLFLLQQMAWKRTAEGFEEPHWTSKTYLLRNSFVTYCLIVMVVGVNLLIIITAGFQGRNKEPTPGDIPGWLRPTVTFSIFGGGIAFWVALVLLQGDTFGKKLGIEVCVHVNKVSESGFYQAEGPNSHVHQHPSIPDGHANPLLAEPTESLAPIEADSREDALRKEALRKEKTRQEDLHKALVEARNDGTNRRLEVKLTKFPGKLAEWLHQGKTKVKKWML